ncbi:SDR family NAD(P)-dependent oxidoreductase [Pseudomonas veronii]|jgi:NAD(P)-dependent dehydrogenase (short-subunit alcohol dehydrogenase family)|uniref:SDR family NAD(P)-dependent oxidoreductase n=4 Tax=Pseudomonas veronii TaxID=76761 RepID=A0A0R3B012_PSEVE|nr:MULTISPECIES: SDR family NAD(P)-dependent oxidoreductase [Pseudomonas]SEC31019.1 Short-chain dehydrogenase [Pseudomonas marginalis]AQY66767.1 short-chain dehydrogenase [Pseudomonas veronii]KRP78530.1 short-chain dehydrogenase [Pseudomonas veronii]MBJ2181843.1 SDR family NAD(P)-dependent oxidoreductase [Pseudomonas veronii]MCT8964843.1 SDR family NAD(P)-dependent oxidoreductase [Pseudomonas veronii]
MKSFNGRVAAITGAASGMGRALALALAREGCHLALADKNSQGLDQTVALIQTATLAPVRVTTQVLDVSDRHAMQDWAARCAAEHGQVNLIFNNAGVALSSTVEGVDYSDLEWIIGINFWGVVYGTKAFLPYLKASGDGHVVNTSSVFGLFAQPGMSGYNASKFAVRGFTEALRQELDLQRCGVSASCVHPGGIRTDICRSSRIDANMTGFLIHSEQQARADFEKLFITDADQAAKVILQGVRKNKRRVLIGRDAYVLDLLTRCLPAAYQALVVFASKRMAPKRPTPLFDSNDESRL